ncbi:MAG: hypothetical protein KDD33_04425 [Bdellovibrionales bacterium]|nr:hypothetical protein [Bdellovibrionales bacterium]
MPYLAAIDIGSNAMRLAIAHQTSEGLHMSFRSREAVRLGQSVFQGGEIDPETYEKLAGAMMKFRNQMENHNVEKFRAIATSAMRNARNKEEIVEKLKVATGISVEVISGDEESQLVKLAVEQKMDLSQGRFLLIDIGGGSIELIGLANGSLLKKQSFPLGTVRALQLMKKQKSHKKLRDWYPQYVRDTLKDFFQDDFPKAVGLGGNMERFAKLKSFVSEDGGEWLSLHEMEGLLDLILSLNYEERISHFALRPDRSDVIVPAALATVEIMHLAKSQVIYLPEVGIKEGILYELSKSSKSC